MTITTLAASAALAFAIAFTFATGSAHAADPEPQDAQEARTAQALFAAHWDEQLQRFPEFATYLGNERYNDRLTDVSPAAIAAADAKARDWLARARAVRADRLSPSDQVSLDMFIGAREREIEQQAFPGFRAMRISALGGPQSQFAGLMQVVPMRTPQQAAQLLARMAAFPVRMDQEIANLRIGMAAGWVPAREVLARVLAQIDGQLALPLEQSPYLAPFNRLPSDIAAPERAALQAAGRQAVQQQVLAALQKLRAFIADEYLPKSPANGALSGYPDGARVYAMQVRQQTTTRLTAAEIHATGQRELARLRAEMEAVMTATKFDGGFAAFVKYLYTDPKFFHTSGDALLAGYRDIAKRIDAEIPKLFAEVPRAPYGIRAMPAFRGPDAAEYYDGPARDGSRAGFFNANALGYKTRPTWGMPTLVAHEAIPGHHLQVARAAELQALPEFRRSGGYTAFSEGWALYAETLGTELGIYDDPYARFGHLQGQAFRAARLVIDTGIHAMGWTRQQAIDFMVERVGEDRNFATAEIDRYTSSPGQALGYMVGELKIIELRDRAKAKLGARFDIRRFHNAVIDQGALPLDVLERVIDAWIAAQAGG